jgi:tetratricopeptide (TPR) repeat protein
MNLTENLSTISSFSHLLRELIISYPEIVKDDVRLEGYLKDHYGSTHKKEIFLIVTAAKSGIIKLLDNEFQEKSITTRYSDIISKFVTSNTLDEESAVWTTVLWAMSLQKMTEKDCQQFMHERNSILFEKRESRSVIPILRNPVSNLVNIYSHAIDQIYENGKNYNNLGDYTEALRCYDKALLINPEDHNILSDKGLSLHNLGDYAEALRCYDKALLINPEDEFVKRRRNNTKEIFQKKYENMDKDQPISQASLSSNLQIKFPSIYIIGLIVVTSGLVVGITAFTIIGSSYNSDQNSSINDFSDTQKRSVVTTSVDTDSNNTLDQQFLSTFADNIKHQIIANPPNGKTFSEGNTNIQMPGVYNAYPNKETQTNESGDVNLKVDEFKLELERAMESNFN